VARRELLKERSAAPQMANRLMKKSNSVDKGDDSFLFATKDDEAFFGAFLLIFPRRVRLF
jgi:hypothetical protein